MQRLFAFLSILAFTSVSCDNEDTLPTGEILVTAGAVTTLDGAPVNQLNVGLFDINVLVTNRFGLDEAIAVSRFDEGKVNFPGLNPGNYVVAIMSSTGYRQAVQVAGGKTVTVPIFD